VLAPAHVNRLVVFQVSFARCSVAIVLSRLFLGFMMVG
jgi:hypothetical protein